MGTAGLQARQGRLSAGGQSKPKPDTSHGSDNRWQSNETTTGLMRSLVKRNQERKEQEQAAAAALSAAEKAAQEKTAALAASARGGATTSTNGYGSNTHIEGNPGQGDNQSQSDVDLSTSDTTRRRRGGYRHDSGITI